MPNSVVRYSDAELAVFQELIEKKLAKAKEQLHSLNEQILEITENSSDEHGGDWVDDSSINNDVEMLNNMAIRQRMYIQDLENALVRIRNKTYGICSITGEMIDKRRLLAVPTTTKSLAAKTTQQQGAETEPPPRQQRPPAPKPVANPKVITKIIRKPTNPTPKPSPIDDDDDDLFPDTDLFFPDDDDPIRRAVNDLGMEEIAEDSDAEEEPDLTDDSDLIEDSSEGEEEEEEEDINY